MAKVSIYRRWLGLSALMPAMAMVFVDQVVLPVALPTIQDHLGATHTELWWCINSYLLISAVLMLPGGKLGDRMGYRRVYRCQDPAGGGSGSNDSFNSAADHGSFSSKRKR